MSGDLRIGAGGEPGRLVAYLNARLIDPASGLDVAGALLAVGGEIKDFGPRLFADGVPSGVLAVDCRGHALIPGLIDTRVFVGEPGAEHKETLASASEAAAAGGITTLVCMPNTSPAIDEPSIVEYVARRARDTSIVNVHPMAAISKGLGGKEIAELGLLKAAGAIAFTDGDRAVGSPLVMRRALSYAKRFDGLIVQHAEEPSLARDGAMNEGEVSTRLGLPGIPTAAEAMMVERDVRLAKLTGGRLHIAQVSCADSIEVIRRAKAEGLSVTCGAAPYHFALNETAIGEYRTFCKTSPPLRTESDRRALVAAIADGTIDVIASGHDPQDVESKRQPFAQAAFGMVGLETMLPLALELVHGGHMPLATALKAMTSAPARLLGLASGVIAIGAPADLAIVHLDVPWRIDPERFKSKSKNAPYEGRPVQGRAVKTVVGGRLVHDLYAA
jgi:dihydroorotase